ncbi:alpha/beta hydrolase [Hymenobacter sp. YC55]|uniref:alpha/beta fold hydrolase n=1 Tax=Hymenobacter sp. YC55 TaxID=3034019 RepID=UPI0023F65904|nr:alpha/beta hydrolase [Hymenobacter sp. YC55]MDF7815248.1 alpha/beta hydrolase [Hymenobacter sp. YC55]
MSENPLLPLPLAPSAGAVVDVPGFQHGYAEVNGTRLHYVSGGSGPVVVLLHGWPYTWAIWRKLLPQLASAGYTVIAPDLRGLGSSVKAPDGYAKTNVARDVHELVQQLGHVKIHLLGMDLGAMVAYAYAASYPAEVRRLVLAESVLPGFGLEELMNPATGGYWHFGFHMQVEVATMLTAGKEVAYLLPTMRMMSTTRDAEAVAREHFLPYYAAPGGMRAGFQHYATLLADGQENRARFHDRLSMPVLVLNGDRGLPQAHLLVGVEQVATDIATDIIPDCGHTIAEDQPQWVADRLGRFFA